MAVPLAQRIHASPELSTSRSDPSELTRHTTTNQRLKPIKDPYQNNVQLHAKPNVCCATNADPSCQNSIKPRKNEHSHINFLEFLSLKVFSGKDGGRVRDAGLKDLESERLGVAIRKSSANGEDCATSSQQRQSTGNS
jgi:hypothetical protein